MSVTVIFVSRMKVGSLNFEKDPTYEKDREKIEELLTRLIPMEGIFSKFVHHLNSGMSWSTIHSIFDKIVEHKESQGVLIYLCEDLNAMHAFPTQLTIYSRIHLKELAGFAKVYFKETLTDLHTTGVLRLR